MPFQSEKQRRYMHANLPDIAKRWERDYAGGGIAELNQEQVFHKALDTAAHHYALFHHLERN